MPQQQSLEDWAKMLASNWEQRASLPSRDLFVASHPGWNDPEAWEKHARIECELFLSGLDPEWLSQADLLEIGCGSGRLIPILEPLVRSYTGFDIAAGMVSVARERTRQLGDVRLFVGNGLDVPDAALDRQYRLIISCAVMIHCPREVILANLKSAWNVLAPGGQLRFSVLGDPTDKEGILVAQAQEDQNVEALSADREGVVAQMNAEERRLAFETYYMGAQFRYAEMAPLVKQVSESAQLVLYRADPYAIYAGITKPPA